MAEWMKRPSSLENARQTLLANDNVAIITESERHWWEAKNLVAEVLGRPQEARTSRWQYGNSKVLRFFTIKHRDIDIRSSHPVRGYDGAIVWFGPSTCDEYHGIKREG